MMQSVEQKGIEEVDVKEGDLGEFAKIIRSVFGLTPAQFRTFAAIRQCTGNGTCISNVVNRLDSERSIIQKYLKVLFDKKLITRRSVTLSEFQNQCKENNRLDMSPSTTKGYLFLYTPISDKDLLEKIHSITNEWMKNVEEFCLLNPVMLVDKKKNKEEESQQFN